MAPIVIAQARSAEVTIRLIERRTSDFVLILDSPGLAAIQGWTTDRAQADHIFNRAVEIAELGLKHPAWKQPTKQTVHINGE